MILYKIIVIFLTIVLVGNLVYAEDNYDTYEQNYTVVEQVEVLDKYVSMGRFIDIKPPKIGVDADTTFVWNHYPYDYGFGYNDYSNLNYFESENYTVDDLNPQIVKNYRNIKDIDYTFYAPNVESKDIDYKVEISDGLATRVVDSQDSIVYIPTYFYAINKEKNLNIVYYNINNQNTGENNKLLYDPYCIIEENTLKPDFEGMHYDAKLNKSEWNKYLTDKFLEYKE